MSDAFRTSNSEESVEHFLAEAISNSPQPLKDLALFLSSALSEDDWKTADRLLLALALRNRTSEPEAGAVETLGPSADFWSNVITHPAPATADKLRVAKEALEPFAALADKFTGPVVEVCDPHPDNPSRNIQPLFAVHLERAFQALAALNEQPQ